MRDENGKQVHHGRKTDRKVNSLDGGKRFKFWTALVEARGELEATRATYSEAAVMMTQRLGFPVTSSNVRDAVHQEIVTWQRHDNRGRSHGSKASAMLSDHDARILALEDVVHRLCLSLGMKEEDQIASTKSAK